MILKFVQSAIADSTAKALKSGTNKTFVEFFHLFSLVFPVSRGFKGGSALDSTLMVFLRSFYAGATLVSVGAA